MIALLARKSCTKLNRSATQDRLRDSPKVCNLAQTSGAAGCHSSGTDVSGPDWSDCAVGIENAGFWTNLSAGKSLGQLHPRRWIDVSHNLPGDRHVLDAWACISLWRKRPPLIARGCSNRAGNELHVSPSIFQLTRAARLQEDRKVQLHHRLSNSPAPPKSSLFQNRI